MTTAVLALQGAFAEHEALLTAIGAPWFELREASDLEKPFDALILPGGESSVQGKLLRDLGLFDPLKRRIEDGLPVLATCAGLILLAGHLDNDTRRYFQTLPVTVERNAYGRQLGSFYEETEVRGIGRVPVSFIRAPLITGVGEGVEVLARTDGQPTAVRYGHQLAMAFHPELYGDTALHRYFLRMAARRAA